MPTLQQRFTKLKRTNENMWWIIVLGTLGLIFLVITVLSFITMILDNTRVRHTEEVKYTTQTKSHIYGLGKTEWEDLSYLEKERVKRKYMAQFY